MNIDNLKFCKDCKYVMETSILSKCMHPASLKLTDFLVDGDAGNRNNYEYASVMRIRDTQYGLQPGCGPSGRHHTPKPIAIESVKSRWRKLLRFSNK